MNFLEDTLLESLVSVASILMDPDVNNTDIEIIFQVDPSIQLEPHESFSDFSTDVDLTDFVEMENINLDNLMDTDMTIHLSYARLLGLSLQSLMNNHDFYLQFELPASVLEFLETINNPLPEKHPVPESVINSFRIVKLDSKWEFKNDGCPICLETFKCKDKALFLSCNHYFHEICIKRWFQEQNFCPVCRQEV